MTNTTEDLGYSGHAATGAKYDRVQYRTSAEIAKGIRADIKAAVADGTLPGKDAGFKYGVRSQRFAGGQSVSINVIGPGDTDWAFRPITDSQQDARAAEYRMTKVYTDEARRIGKLLDRIGNAYTYRDIDTQVDYFNVTCYINVYCGSGGLCL